MRDSNERRVWLDAEKIPADLFDRRFVPPPGIDLPPRRSTLLLGTRGVGKTSLLKFLERPELSGESVALSIDLYGSLAHIGRDAGIGAWEQDVDERTTDLVQGKTSATLAWKLADEVQRRGFTPGRDLLQACIPESIEVGRNGSSSSLAKRILDEPLESFAGIAKANPLREFVNDFSKRISERGKEVRVLLDRADMVSPAVLSPIVSLLDQSGSYTCVLASRPGHGYPTDVFGSTIPRDHFDVTYLGANPESDQWAEFVRTVLAKIFGPELERVPPEVQDFLIGLGRDSIRTTIDLSDKYLSFRSEDRVLAVRNAVEKVRVEQLGQTEEPLRGFQDEFRRLISDLRKQATSKGTEALAGPIEVTLKSGQSSTLADPSAEVVGLVDRAMRSGAFCLSGAHNWTPSRTPTTFVVAPILTWKYTDPFWSFRAGATPTRVPLTESQLLRSFGGPAKNLVIFVAYNFGNPKSEDFRKAIESRMKRAQTPAQFSKCEVVDGHGEGGRVWAHGIRDRLTKARVVLADVTTPRHEIYFESGLAHSIGKTVVFAVGDERSGAVLPDWVRKYHVETFGSTTGMASLMRTIAREIAPGRRRRPHELSASIPGTAVWIRRFAWNGLAVSQFKMAIEQSFRWTSPRIFDDVKDHEEVIATARAAQLVVVSLDGTKDDLLMYYIAGLVCGAPNTTEGDPLPRLLVVVADPSMCDSNSRPDKAKLPSSLDAYQRTVKRCSTLQLPGLISAFVKDPFKGIEQAESPRLDS